MSSQPRRARGTLVERRQKVFDMLPRASRRGYALFCFHGSSRFCTRRSSLSSSREAQRGKTRDDATAKKRFQSNSANNEKDGAKRALVLSKTRTFAREDVEQFAKITGDSNPIHVSRTATTDDNNIVHGALLVSMFPAIVGSTFPGAKYLRQTAMFRNECPVGARVTATVRKVKETRGGAIVEFETKVRCAEDEGKVYVDGFALAKIE